MQEPAAADFTDFTDFPESTRPYRIASTLFVVAALGMLVLVLVMFGSALLAGGQFGPESDVKWDVVVAWPAVRVPAWLVIALCWMGTLSAVVMAPAARWPQAPELISSLGFTAIMFVVLPIGFSRMYPALTGVGDHWRGALPQVITVVVLGVRLAMLAPRYNAVRREGLAHAATYRRS